MSKPYAILRTSFANIALVLILVAVFSPALSLAQNPPLSFDDVYMALQRRGRTPGTRTIQERNEYIARRANEWGISFDLDERMKASLYAIGAANFLIATLESLTSVNQAKRCNPQEQAGCFGKNVYQYRIFLLESQDATKSEYVSKEARLFKVDELPKIGDTFSWPTLFPGKTWRVLHIGGSIIEILEVKVNPCDPTKDADCYGEGVFDYRFVSYAENPEKLKQLGSLRIKLISKLAVGDRYLWRNQSWRCYSVTGSIAWFTEAIRPVTQLLTQTKGGRYFVPVPRDGNWYQIIMPLSALDLSPNVRNVYFQNRGDYSIILDVNGKELSLDRNETWHTSVDLKQPVFVKKNSYTTGKEVKLWIEYR